LRDDDTLICTWRECAVADGCAAAGERRDDDKGRSSDRAHS